MNRRAAAHPISVIILTAAIIVIVIVASAYIGTALYSSNANLEFQTMEKTSTSIADIMNTLAFKRFASDGIQMNLRYGDMELFSSGGFTITITYNSSRTLTLNLPSTYNFSYVQNTGYIVLGGARYLAGNGSLFAGAGQQLVNVYEWKSGKVAYISVLSRVQYSTQDITFYNGTKVTYLYLNYLRFNSTSSASRITFYNIFNFRAQASDLSVQVWKIVTSAFSASINICGIGCSFSVSLPSARTVVIVASTSTITLSKA